jgi:ribitol-5-phosphate 2-dehydrogenase
MIGRIYRLMDVKRIEMKQREIIIDGNSIIVRPEYMSICAADQRYYLGNRKKEIMRKKLPMSLIHEATAVVLYDVGGKLQKGEKVVLIPLKEGVQNNEAKGNYRLDSSFASSGTDGFMQDIISVPFNRVIPIADSCASVFVLSEIMSVAIGAINEFEKSRHTQTNFFGVWGDGSMGFAVGLALRCMYPSATIYAFGKTARRLQKFSFATRTFYVDSVPKDITVSHAFECVGGIGSSEAIRQIIDIISPQGCINLLGVSEDSVAIDTRMVLEKGLCLLGHSRSDYNDFSKAIELIRGNDLCKKYLNMLISEIIEVKTEKDITYAFEQDVLNDFKTIIKWLI